MQIKKKLLLLTFGLITSLSLQISLANPNICQAPSNDLETVTFQDCPNGFTFATFNRYANVNIFGQAGLEASKLESESDHFLSMRKYVPKSERAQVFKDLYYEAFQKESDPNHSNFIPYTEFYNHELNAGDIVEFQIYLHNNGNPRCNFDPTACNKRTYAINPKLDFYTNFDATNNSFNALDLTLSYQRPRANGTTSNQSYKRAEINNLLKSNQRLQLLTAGDLQGSQNDKRKNDQRALTTGVETIYCSEFKDNKKDCKTYLTKQDTQENLIRILTSHINIDRASKDLDLDDNIFLASTGYAIRYNFFAKVIEEPPVCEGDIDVELLQINTVENGPDFEFKEGESEIFLGQAKYKITAPEDFNVQALPNENSSFSISNRNGTQPQILTYKWRNFDAVLPLFVPNSSAENACSTALKLPQCDGLDVELNENSINLEKQTANLIFKQKIKIDDDQIKHYGPDESTAIRNIAQSFNSALRFTHKNKLGAIKSQFEGTNNRDNNSLESTYNVIIVPKDTNFEEDFEIQDDDSLGEKVVKGLFKALTVKGEDQAFFWKTDLEACDIIEANCLHFEDDCKQRIEITPPTCGLSKLEKISNGLGDIVLELQFQPNLKVYHENIRFQTDGDFTFDESLETSVNFDEDNLTTTIKLKNDFDNDDELTYSIPASEKLCNPFAGIQFEILTGIKQTSVINSVLNPNQRFNNFGLDLNLMRQNLNTGLNPNINLGGKLNIPDLGTSINPSKIEIKGIDPSAFELSENRIEHNSILGCRGEIKATTQNLSSSCQLTTNASSYIPLTQSVLITYDLDESFEEELEITTEPAISADKININTTNNSVQIDVAELIEAGTEQITITMNVVGEDDCNQTLNIEFPPQEEKVCSLTAFSLNETDNSISYVLENEDEFEDNLVVEYAGAFRLDTILNKIFLDEVIAGATIKLKVESEENCEAEITLEDTPEENVSCENLEILSPNPSEEFDFRDITSVRFATQPRNFNDVFNLTITREDGSRIFGESSSKRLSRDFLQALNQNQALDPNAKLEIVSQRFPRSCRAEIQGTFETPSCQNLTLTDLDGSEITEIPRAGSSFIKFQTTSSDGSDFSFPITFRPASSEAVVQSVGSDRLESQNIALITPNGEDDFQFFAEGFTEKCMVTLATNPNIENETLEIATGITKAASKTVITQNDFVDYQINFQVEISSIPDSIEGDFISYTLKDSILSDQTININYNSATINGIPFNAQDLDTGLTIEVPAERGIHNFNINYRVNFNFAGLNQFCTNDRNDSCGLDIINTAQILETADAASAVVRMLCPYLVTRSFGDILFNKAVDLNTIDLSKCTALPNTQSPIFQQKEQTEGLAATGGDEIQAPTKRICREEGDIENISSGVCETISINGPNNELNLEKVRKTLNFQLRKFTNINNLSTQVDLNSLENERDLNETDEKNVFHTNEKLKIKGRYTGDQAILILAEGDITITGDIKASNAPIAIVSLNGNILIDKSVNSIQASLITVTENSKLKIKQGAKDEALEIKGTIISDINTLYDQIEFVGDISQNQGRLTIIYDGRVQFMPPPGLSDPLIFNMQSQ